MLHTPKKQQTVFTWVERPLPMKAEGAEKAAAEATTAEATTVRSILVTRVTSISLL